MRGRAYAIKGVQTRKCILLLSSLMMTHLYCVGDESLCVDKLNADSLSLTTCVLDGNSIRSHEENNCKCNKTQNLLFKQKSFSLIAH